MRGFIAILLSIGLGLSACGDFTPKEQSAEEFYRGRTLTLIVGFSTGGGYDLLARTVARYMERTIPGNPTIIVQNMPGAGSLVAANHMFNVSPKDGSVFGIFIASMPLAPLWKVKEAQYDPLGIQWLGSLADNGASVVFVRSDAPATTLEEAMVKTVLLGSTGPGATTSAYPVMLNDLIGTKFKLVFGYQGTGQTMLAIERGEVHGRADNDWRSIVRGHPDWMAKNFVVPLVQLTLKPHPAIPNVPLALDYVKDEKDKEVLRLAFGAAQFTRAFSMAPEVPKDRVAVLRKAFEDIIKDPNFVREAEATIEQPLTIASAQEIDDFVRAAYALPEDVKDLAARYAISQ
jgi:tripartite-type tricarboxylate transporter receptor subunit TctC